MTSCTDYEPLIAERATAAQASLDPADAAALAAHLASCAHCRAELAAYAQALGLARLPEPSDAERQALAWLPAQVRGELDRAPIVKGIGRLLLVGALAAGIVVVVANRVVIPSATRQGAAVTAATARWQEPDPEALLERVVKENPELATSNGDLKLARAEELADAAYLRAVEEE
ncbi:MAG TPA: zf-HC2 domain-containing protein [Anaeromyxobacteraceae bacterium]|nr:zf-HC2 domain-containing protein [Anaeromyxobacteraceae bacterium]